MPKNSLHSMDDYNVQGNYNAIDLFRSVRDIAREHLTHYGCDLDVDLYSLGMKAANGPIPPFIHMTRECGTHMDFLESRGPNSPSSGRLTGSSVLYFAQPSNRGQVKAVLYFDGQDLWQCDIDTAKRLLESCMAKGGLE